MNELDFKEDLKQFQEKKRLEAEENERLRKEAEEREIAEIREKDIRTDSGSLKKIGGRPKGSKNRANLFKEAMREGFEEVLEREGMKVFIATCQRAVGTPVRDENNELVKDENGNQLYEGGSDTASKIIMDRIVPVADFDKTAGSGKTVVNINVSGLKAEVDVMDGEYEEMDDVSRD